MGTQVDPVHLGTLGGRWPASTDVFQSSRVSSIAGGRFFC